METTSQFTDEKQVHHVPTAVLAADLAPDGETLFCACMDGVYQVDVQSGEFEKLHAHDSYVSGAAHVAARNLLITSGYDGALQWFDLESRQRTRRVQVHDFWSWDMAASPDGRLVASVTGQYLAGGYKYEPQAQREPSVRIVNVESGEIVYSLPHVPSVQSVAFSPDGRFVAAGNLMGEVRVWDVDSGQLAARWTTPDFTSWGIIKSHCYLGGIFALQFTPDGEHLLLAGMGPMRDPMAGNGRQLWQRFAWRENPPSKIDETHSGESGEGLMETLALHPDGNRFVMSGRLRGGAWNAGLFDLESGRLLGSLKTGCRVTSARFLPDGERLILSGTQGQPREKRPGDDGTFPHFGRVDVYRLTPA